MIRKATKMKVFPHKFDEYKTRHDQLWPEMEAMLKQYGAHHYSIFLDEEEAVLFAYVVLESIEQWNLVSQTKICQKWWNYMKDLMETNEDNSPKSWELKEIFYLE